MTNYQKLGLKVGIECHVQLDTKHKLFCSCSTEMKEKFPLMTIKRKQHPVASELGEVDIASQYEFMRDRTFNYQVFPKEVCLVCLDEEPPQIINQEALEIATQISLLLNCEIPDELHVMRKTVTDGSNTTGFQRTLIVGMNGFMKYKGGKIPIKQISLEEDAAAIVGEENGSVTYKLSRLGVPLVEISTDILSGYTTEEIEEIAFGIGMVCRSTKKTKRVIGSIRQDVNVSISQGARVEIKGVQELSLLSKVIDNEVQRQLSLGKIKNELKRRGVHKLKVEPVDVTKHLQETKNNILRVIVAKSGSIFALLLPKFSGLLGKELFNGKTFGRELADIASDFGVKGIFHTDEDLTKYNLIDDFQKIRNVLKAREDDSVLLVGELNAKGKVVNKLAERCSKILEKMEEETRSATEDGTTRYMRPLPGAARLYVETDLFPVPMTKEVLERIKKQLPEPWDNKLRRLESQMKLSHQLALQMMTSEYFELFDEIVQKTKVSPIIVANTFTSILKDLKRRNLPVETIDDEKVIELFKMLDSNKVTKESITILLEKIIQFPGETVANLVKDSNLSPISESELKELVRAKIEENKEKLKDSESAFKYMMGVIMGIVRGRIDGEIVNEVVKTEVKKFFK